jgi:DNA repair exonuclease SbcCD ATPase subunit
MNIVHSIGLKGVSPFKEVTFKVPLGLSVVYGLNRASGKASKNSNGVGKSYLLNTPAEVVYEEPIVGEKQDRTKRGQRAFSFTNYAGKKIIASRIARGRSEKLVIKENGEDKQFRTPTYAKAYLKKAWPITQEEYNTYVHIDSRVSHPLVMGTSAERKRFFTSFFGLDKIDAERKLYVAELNRLMKIQSAFNELRHQWEKAKTDLMAQDVYDANVERLALLKKKLKGLRHKFSKVQDTARLVSFAQSAKEQIKVLARACGGTVSEEEFERAFKANTWELKKVEADLEEAETWEQYKRDTAHYTAAYDRLTPEARKLIAELGSKDAVGKARDAQRLLLQYREALKRRRADADGVEQQLGEPMPKPVAKPEGDQAELETLQRAYQHQLNHAEKFQEGKCETCGQVVKIKDPKVLKRKLESVITRLEQFDAYAEYRKAKADRQKLEFKLKSYKTDAQRALDKVNEVKDLAALYTELKDLPTKPRAFKGKKLQIEVLKRMLIEIRERRSLLEYLQPHLETIIQFQALTSEDLLVVKESDGLSDRMNQVQDRAAQLQAKIEVHDTMAGRVQDMRQRLVKMKRELKDVEPLKLLVQGFQDKNLKKMAIEAIGQRLMGLVNKFAAPVFPEQFSFEFKWDTQIQLIVHRKNGEPSDVRRLSGAESTIFTLILVGALLAFVPSRKRCSLLILDEPSARMHKETTELFQKVLQVLNKTIPSIVVITPRSEEIYEGAKPFTVVKDNKGVARLIEGYPHQVAVKH